MKPKAKKRLKRALLIAVWGAVGAGVAGRLCRLGQSAQTAPMALRWVKGWFTVGEQQRNLYCWLDLQAVPDDFLKCILMSEDHRFFEHWGFH